MSGLLFGSGLRIQAAVKRKVFVSYHHDGDQAYYDAFSRAFHDTYDVITDNSLDRQIDSEDVEYVMRRIRENYIAGSSCTIVLVGKDTYARKYVDWEIKATLDAGHSLIGVQLPTLSVNAQRVVTIPERLNDNINSGYALWLTWADITRSPQTCQTYIEAANVKNKRLIDNTRARRLRNG
ncbi:TIR domain-containing protein [Acetobacter peroxydans]|uniref:Thoeris protein ThsB TIR-like domain-containing protein n=1 Tax=Acetobacter peroxydans TaxID=104098 RepID=A0A4Y3TWW7_9PROT|nr:TIR domain-containing protein [Acetobacter peroxydans]NHO17172.1 hypothetical protein [Acetobacter peroxydans]GBR35598.1 hypothetical protein AA13755_1275 [Acetobacter peroxydans NBRC 13755]GBR39414.1 hypothetical protein AA0475_0177 [Acetobacter peroxydans]GEB86208.1 hypothetical protein APE01nite_20050 [Acetobacter peroxydans]